MRIGSGYDIHRLEKGRSLVIGGVSIPFDRGALGHSDGDALIHAVADAVLGALARGDIGTIFPDDDPGTEGMDSARILESVRAMLEEDGMSVLNVDSTVVIQEPRIAPYRKEMETRIGALLGVGPGAVSVKAKTAEGMGETGSGAAVEAHAVVLITSAGGN